MMKNKFQFWMIVLISSLPIILGTLLFVNYPSLGLKTINHGVLINPPLTLHGFKNDRHWRIFYVYHTHCDAHCKNISYQLHQIQKALGKDGQRVSIVTTNTNRLVSGRIYLMDPMGNVFMYYPDTADPMNILKDLKKVLEVSQIG